MWHSAFHKDKKQRPHKTFQEVVNITGIVVSRAEGWCIPPRLFSLSRRHLPASLWSQFSLSHLIAPSSYLLARWGQQKVHGNEGQAESQCSNSGVLEEQAKARVELGTLLSPFSVAFFQHERCLCSTSAKDFHFFHKKLHCLFIQKYRTLITEHTNRKSKVFTATPSFPVSQQSGPDLSKRGL